MKNSLAFQILLAKLRTHKICALGWGINATEERLDDHHGHSERHSSLPRLSPPRPVLEFSQHTQNGGEEGEKSRH
jgi:hypothetical protein